MSLHGNYFGDIPSKAIFDTELQNSLQLFFKYE